MVAIMSLMFVIGCWLTDTMILLQRMKHQQGMRAAGIEDRHNLSWILLLLGSCRKLNPRFGWLLFVVIVMSIDSPKGLEVSLKGTCLEIVARTTESLQVSSSSGMMLGYFVGAIVVMGVVGVRNIGDSMV